MSELRERRYAEVADTIESSLPAGDVTEGVVRVGGTVRRPHQPQSYAVAAYLDHLHRAGFDGAPRFLGRDDRGRDVLSYVGGDVAGALMPGWALSDRLLVSVAELIRRLHAASAGFAPLEEPFPSYPWTGATGEIVTHMDITPQNVVVRGGVARAVIDFDLARPSTVFAEQYNTIMHWAPLRAPSDIGADWSGVEPLRRLRLFADACGWTPEQRMQLASSGADAAVRSRSRMRSNAETLGGGWARMWAEGVGDVIERRAEWLLAEELAITSALLD